MRFTHTVFRAGHAVVRCALRRTAITAIMAVYVTGALMAACSTASLLDVVAPANVPVSRLNEPGNAVLMVHSAIGDFECAFGAAVSVEAIISDELADAQLGAAAWPYDRRDFNTQTNGAYGTGSCTDNQTPGIYAPLSTARWSADHAVTNLTGWTDAQVPNRMALLAQANLYAGFSYATLGMAMCSAAFDLGPEVQQTGMFALAEARFTAAITAAQASSSTNILRAAYVGRARVRLFLGNKTGAAADAALVPVGFALNSSNDASDNRLYNRIYAITQQFGTYTIEANSRNLVTDRGEVDPRSAAKLVSTRPADAKSPIWVPLKFAAGDAAPMPVARYEEAQLILAEAQGGASAVSIINALRTAAGLLSYTGATDAASIQNLIIDERRRALFTEGFRNYDMQRFNVALNPAAGTAYPIKGGTYGTTRCLPLPDVERFNNPNIK